MEFTILVFTKLLALFSFVILGFIARKFLNIDRTSIAKLVFYILSPLVFFNALGKLEYDPSLLALPLITATISSSIAIIIYNISKHNFDNATRSILSFSASNANVGYFLLPIVWEFFDIVAAGIYITMVLGNSLYENTVGFFIASRGKLTLKESLIKIIKLPTLYAMILGFVISYIDQLYIPNYLDDILLNIKGSYATLGMMMIGIGLADIKEYKLDYKFISASFIVKFLLWPLFSLALIAIDKTLIHAYDPVVYKMLILFSIAPLAANNIIIATVLDLHPEKVAASVVLSTIFALFYVPFVIIAFKLI